MKIQISDKNRHFTHENAHEYEILLIKFKKTKQKKNQGIYEFYHNKTSKYIVTMKNSLNCVLNYINYVFFIIY